LVLSYIEKKYSKLNAVFKVVKMNSGSKFGGNIAKKAKGVLGERVIERKETRNDPLAQHPGNEIQYF